ncbi:MAG: patatin-like phospholipase family protein, partial [Alphaproteobacteria bacterium]|nr:patatin-like phospholipase family protein [Alphaproteobacteria bacterium]
YEGGVLTEALYQLDRYNRRNEGNTYVIDVITGGSAGSITGALTARVMMHGYDELRTILHDLWVTDADVVKLLAYPSDSSLFASRYQVELGEKYLGVDGDQPRPASFAPDKLRIAFSLSNMVGVDYGFPYRWANSLQDAPAADASGEFLWTFFSDFFEATVQRGTEPDKALWDGIRDAGIASGGFPVAFAPSYVDRDISDFPGSLETDLLPGGHAISDGGMFNNEPVRRAIALASELDGGSLSSDRVFILIDPNINTSKQDARYAENASRPGLFENVKRLLVMALGEAEARDWLRVGRYNARLGWRDELITEFVEFINALDPAALAARLSAATERNDRIVAQMAAMGVDIDQAEAMDRIAGYHTALISQLGAPGDAAEIGRSREELFKRLVFSIDSAGSLTSKSPIDLFVIGADKDETAGEGLFSLAGFFEEHWPRGRLAAAPGRRSSPAPGPAAEASRWPSPLHWKSPWVARRHRMIRCSRRPIPARASRCRRRLRWATPDRQRGPWQLRRPD